VTGTWLVRLRALLARATREGISIPVVVMKENEQPDRLTMSSAGCGFLSSSTAFQLSRRTAFG
jgi:hypothetical protein